MNRKKLIKIEIRSCADGSVLFELEKERNTVKDTLEKAVKLRVKLTGANLRKADLSGTNLSGVDLSVADLRGANLSDANLSCANLRGAGLKGTNLSAANLRGANLSSVDLREANLSLANLIGADLSVANLNSVDLSVANLRGANLSNANIRVANLRGANLTGANLYCTGIIYAKNVPFIPYACPSEGSFIGWKKISLCMENYGREYIVKLRIPKDARRCSAITSKCRCDKAEVLEIVDIKTNNKINSITNLNKAICVYKVGEMVYPDSFDENRWNECGHGIHFFINKQEAIDYK